MKSTAQDPGGPHVHEHQNDVDGQAEILELDAEVLAGHTASITAWLPVEASPHQIVDLGCGTGAGTFALLTRFPEAQVTAVDSSADHLHRLRDKARENGLADRVRTVAADLDSAWPDLGKPDLVWASASLHHMTDPDRTLRQVHDMLAPGGLFAVVELAGLPRFLPDDAPGNRPGLEERCHAASDHRHAGHVPHRGADWGPKLTAAGFTLEGERTITVDIEHSRSPAVGRYALATLRRLRGAVADVLSADDLTALDQLLDTGSSHSILRRDDLAVRTERRVWAARRTLLDTANNAGSVPAGYEAWRKSRWDEIAGPNGKVKVVANGRVTGPDSHVIPGVPGQWSITEAGALTVSVAADDGMTVNGEAVNGTTEVPSGSSLEFSDGRAGFAGGADGFYGVVVMDHGALARSGLSGIDTYPYDPAWVLEGVYRAAPEGRRIEVGRLTTPRSTEAILAPVDLAVTVNGTEYVLSVLEDMPGQRLVVFTDETNRSGTPEIGRWLVLPLLEPGSTLTVDFNQATLSHHHLVPAVFTCPLPPPGNHLPMRVEAGERALVYAEN
ncbi:DUF1684 domain-containing protein [Saccharomonospora sp. NPDC046836]|uniref:DUF1684 domain-containing protein n=1 Tax=Saccharomonospora sp. NPDC046836 TaxID=3156921 RepID=UPI0033D35726